MLPTTRLLHSIHLTPVPSVQEPSIQEKFLERGWQALSSEERLLLIEQGQQIWQMLSTHQRNCLVVEALGHSITSGPVPLWSTSPMLTSKLYQRAYEDLFCLDTFADILYLLLSWYRGFGYEESGLPLLETHQRALHLFTLMSAATPDRVAFAFVLAYSPHSCFVQDQDPERTLVHPKLQLVQV